MKTVAQIANDYGVTPLTIRLWIKKGCPYEVEKVVGYKPRMILDPEKVKEWLNIPQRKD